MFDNGNKWIERSLNPSKELITSFEEKFDMYPKQAKKLISTTSSYIDEIRTNVKIDPNNFRRLSSFNNTVFKFSSVGKESVVIKMFSDSNEGEAAFKIETAARDLLLKSGLFYPKSGVIIPKPVFRDFYNNAEFTVFIENTEPLYYVKIGERFPSQILDFLIKLNEIGASAEGFSDFPFTSKYATSSAYETYQNAVGKLEKFKIWMNQKDNLHNGIIRWCGENDFINKVESHFQTALDSVDPQILHKKTEPEEMRFNWGDVSLPNLSLKTVDNSNILIPFDLEYAGWDHFSQGLISLLLHHSSEKIKMEPKKELLKVFAKNSRLSSTQIEELDTRLVVGELLFIARKIVAASKGASEIPGLRSMRGDRSYESLKIDEFLKPALRRIEAGFLRVE